MVGGDALAEGALDGGFGEFAGCEVWVAGAEGGEEGEEGDLQRGGGVGVEAVVGFYDYEAGGGGGTGSSRVCDVGG